MNDNDHLLWEHLDSKTLFDTRILRLKTVRRQSAQGAQASFISVDAPNWVTIIPELPGGEEPSFLVVRQYRHGSQKLGLEFPAGIIDSGEIPVDAAARELLEETGYKAKELRQIGRVSPNPAFMTNTTYTYWARGLEKVSDKLDLDEHEILDVHPIGFKELKNRIGEDPYDSAITVHAWHFYLKAAKRI